MTSDFVTSELLDRRVSFARLNVEDLPSYSITLDPVARRLTARAADHSFTVGQDGLRGVYFRQPVFLRASMLQRQGIEEQIARQQWAAFVRSLTLFDEARWVNAPGATYLAEHKAKQLAVATALGFDVPRTAFTNSADALHYVAGGRDTVAIKGIDTILARTMDREFFGYTDLVQTSDLGAASLSSVPFILQESIDPKLDLRVTVVGEQCWAAAVTSENGEPITGDWRLRKGASLSYRRFELPTDVTARCVALVRELGLSFGAIDLAVTGGRFLFFEINPTGEWAWLSDQLGFPIAAALCDALTCK